MQLGRQPRVLEHGNDPAALLANVDRCGRVRQADDDAATAIARPAEIDARDRTGTRRI